MRSFPHFIKGTLLLTCAGLLCRFSGFFYKIFLAHALGAEGIGIYQLIFPVFAPPPVLNLPSPVSPPEL